MKKLIIFGTGQVADIISHYFKNDSNIKILPTIKSRSHEFKFFLTTKDKKDIYEKILVDYGAM